MAIEDGTEVFFDLASGVTIEPLDGVTYSGPVSIFSPFHIVYLSPGSLMTLRSRCVQLLHLPFLPPLHWLGPSIDIMVILLSIITNKCLSHGRTPLLTLAKILGNLQIYDQNKDLIWNPYK